MSDVHDGQIPPVQGQPPNLADQLLVDESVVAWLKSDLDSTLRFAETLIVLTNRRLLAYEPKGSASALGNGSAKAPGAGYQWRSWNLEDIASLRLRDRAGLGVLEAHGSSGLLARWNYTISQAADAGRLVQRFENQRRGSVAEHDGLGESEAAPGGAPAKPASAMALLRLSRFAKPRKGLIVLGFLLTLATTAAGLIPPYLTMPIMDQILIPYQNRVDAVRGRTDLTPAQKHEQLEQLQHDQGPEFRMIIWYLVGLAGAAAAAWVLGWAQGAVMAWVSERVSADLRNETYSHIQRLSLEFFGGKRTGDLMSRISTDTERINSFLSDNLVDFGTDVLMIIGTAIILIWIDPVLGIATLCSFPLIGWLIYRIRGQLQHGFRRGGRAWGAMTSVLADTIPGIRVVKAFAQERREVDRFRQANDHVVAANDRVNRVWTFFWPLVVMLNQIGLLVVWAFGAWRVFGLYISVGVLTAFLFYISRFYMRLESMSRMLSVTQRAAASAQRIFEILDRVPSVAEPTHPVHPGRLRGEVEFRNVSFRHGNRPILEDVSLKIRPGELIGLVGPSGAGKSTLVNLVCRFYDVSEGSIIVDGTDIRSFAVEEYRRHIGIVLQDPFLFFGTIAENIAYGKPDATRAEIVAAAKAARAHEFILRLADGYDSMVGERGQALSGGERQRISIARALLIDPRILILDEATSSVDTETEREIQAALDHLVQGRTTIAIAHRLSTLRKADRLVVLERGRIVQTGVHSELLDVPGVYARLHRAQMELTEGLTH